jgi:2-keto-4-pentenoate hydratase/2-oxohepta-3-ene-1,7-dioic acid hydratase in catechol pathway
MARWDGMFPLFWGVAGAAEQQTYLRQMVAAVQELRERATPGAASQPFDVLVSGETPSGPPAAAARIVEGYRDAGATWWLESLNPERGDGEVWPFGQLRDRVMAGPPHASC